MFKNSTLSVQLFEITLMREEILDTLSLRNIIVALLIGDYIYSVVYFRIGKQFQFRNNNSNCELVSDTYLDNLLSEG